MLEDPSVFEVYRNYVIERSDFQQLSCATPWEVAFGAFQQEAAAG
jgi:hypothetical protein